MTPAMAAGVTRKSWTLADLLEAARGAATAPAGAAILQCPTTSGASGECALTLGTIMP